MPEIAVKGNAIIQTHAHLKVSDAELAELQADPHGRVLEELMCLCRWHLVDPEDQDRVVDDKSTDIVAFEEATWEVVKVDPARPEEGN